MRMLYASSENIRPILAFVECIAGDLICEEKVRNVERELRLKVGEQEQVT